MSNIPPEPGSTKPAVQSTTLQAIVTAAVPATLLLVNDAVQMAHGVALSATDLTLAAGAAVTVIGAGVAIWGRCRPAVMPIAGFFKTPGQ